MTQKKYLKEEFHRGEWIPLMITNKNTGEKEQAYARITDLDAEQMNMYAKEYKVRYILADAQSEEENIKDIYQREVGKKPFGGWDDEKIKEKLEEFRNSQ